MAVPGKNYYKILQVDQEAEQEVIEAAYRRLARKYHPDVNLSAETTQRMQELNEAYRVLRDPAQRSDYDGLLLDWLRPRRAPEEVDVPRGQYVTPAEKPQRATTAPGRTGASPEATSAPRSSSPSAEYRGFTGQVRPREEPERPVDLVIVAIVAVTFLLVCPPFFYLIISTAGGR